MDLKNILGFAESIARKAGAVQKEKFEKKGLQVEHKGRIDLVTEVDIECEKIISSAITKEYPDHGILSEEGTASNADAKSQWIVDPLDGTTNFAHGFPIFAVSIGFAVEGRPSAGVVYDPLRDEMFSAIKGKGAFLNGKTIKVSDTVNIEDALVATGFPYDLKTNPRNNLDNFNRVILECQAIRRPGSAAIDLCYVAAGRFDAFWEQRLYPWDIAAGALIASEAGGKVTDMKGNELDIFNETICAANSKLHPKLLSLLED